MQDIIQDPVLAEEEIHVIEQHMMDYSKYLPCVVGGNFTIRCGLYPFNLVKTRLQTQVGTEVYNGTLHAFRSIYKYEGIAGLYRGVGISIPQTIPSLFYILTYEGVRHQVNSNTALSDNSMRDNLIKAFVGGGVASVVGQTFSVPLDIVTQHIMLIGRRKAGGGVTSKTEKFKTLQEIHIPAEMQRKRFGTVQSVVSQIYKRHGVLGFYNGYIVSLCFFVPNSAIWWTTYELYREWFFKKNFLPNSPSRLFICTMIAAPMASITTSIILNPLDLLRVRTQVKHMSVRESVASFRKEEGKHWWLKSFWKGLSARLSHSIIFSITVIPLYESIKQSSLLDEYKDMVR